MKGINNKHITELTTYEEIPQFLKLRKQDITLPNDKIWFVIVGLCIDYIVFTVYSSPYGYMPIWTASFTLVKCLLDEYKQHKIINMKAIREITETITPDEPLPLVVNTATQSRVIRSISDDRQLQGYLLAGRDYDALSAYYASCDDKGFRRDDSASGKGAKTLCNGVTSSNFGMLRNALKVDGYIDDKNNWTDKGIRWLNA